MEGTSGVIISDKLRKIAIECFKEEGAKWLDDLPEIVADRSRRWSVTVGTPFAYTYANYVATARREDGTEVVFKSGTPNSERLSELEALRLYDGDGAVRVLEADDDGSCMLLEKANPGNPLSTLQDDEKTTAIAATLMKRLWRPVPDGSLFPTVAEYALEFERLRSQFDGDTGPFPPRVIERAERHFKDLLASSNPNVLLHGDIHHDNILMAEREPWLVIDPHGLVGDPGYDLGAWLENPEWMNIRTPNLQIILKRRIEVLAEVLEWDRAYTRDWAIAVVTLRTSWGVEADRSTWNEEGIAFAEVVSQLE